MPQQDWQRAPDLQNNFRTSTDNSQFQSDNFVTQSLYASSPSYSAYEPSMSSRPKKIDQRAELLTGNIGQLLSFNANESNRSSYSMSDST